jgi:hypothetical protein
MNHNPCPLDKEKGTKRERQLAQHEMIAKRP